VVCVVLAVAPIVVGAVSLVGDTWYPVGDWASMLFRTGQVGSRDTPLVGAYTVKGWAHPGPFLYYAATPLFRLTSGDPRSMAWSAAVVNVATIAALGVVAWRRGRLALVLASMTLVALLVRGFGADTLVDLWNPFLGLLPFLLVLFLAWDASLGRPGSVLVAAAPAAIAIQCHVSFAPLIGVVAVWLLCWCRWWRRLVPGDPAPSGDLVDVRPPEPPWARWRTAVVGGLVVAAVVSLPPLFDLVFDTHNLVSVAGHLAVGSGEQIGPVHGLGLVSRYTRPDGPWMGGVEPSSWTGVQGSGPLVALVVLALLGGCVRVARRRRLVDVAALATLTTVLVIASIAAASNLVNPLFPYLTQWLKVVGGMVWFTIGWTLWRLAARHVRRLPARRVAAALAGGVLVVASASTWNAATRVELAAPFESEVVQNLRAQLDEGLRRDATYRVEGVADSFGHNAAGVIFYMIEDGHDVVTSDGAAGLKWGHAHAWNRGDRFDVQLTVAVHYGGSWRNAYNECAADPGVDLVAEYDKLDPLDRAELDALRQERRTSHGSFTEADLTRVQELERNGFRVGVFAGDRGCARTDPSRRANDD